MTYYSCNKYEQITLSYLRTVKYSSFCFHFSTVSNCPPSENMWNFWIQFQNYCYFRSSFVRAWNEARSHCLTRGSNLISIHNEEENKFLSMAIYAKTWLGLNDQNHEGQLKWTDKSPLTYTNYRNGTQNLDKLDYLVLQESGKWTFDDGTSYTAIICKRNGNYLCTKNRLDLTLFSKVCQN